VLLVDTNIVAYLLIDGDYTEVAQDLRRRDPDWRSEAFLLVEFTNVLASSIATKRMSDPLAEDILFEAITLLDGKLVQIPHPSIVSIAVRYGVTAYDARFLALAHRLGSRLVTEDAKLRSAVPALTQSLAEALARS
jgi:predicted nucleic acid-binding protein